MLGGGSRCPCEADYRQGSLSSRDRILWCRKPSGKPKGLVEELVIRTVVAKQNKCMYSVVRIGIDWVWLIGYNLETVRVHEDTDHARIRSLDEQAPRQGGKVPDYPLL